MSTTHRYRYGQPSLVTVYCDGPVPGQPWPQVHCGSVIASDDGAEEEAPARITLGSLVFCSFHCRRRAKRLLTPAPEGGADG